MSITVNVPCTITTKSGLVISNIDPYILSN